MGGVADIKRHVPVLLEEAVSVLGVGEGDVVLDGTFGRGGHTRRFLQAVGPQGLVVALDVDVAAAEAAEEICAPNFRFVRQNFRNLDVALRNLSLPVVDKVFFDLGVSSPQLDEADRGFSYKFDAVLDMRLDPLATTSARTLLARASEAELEKILWEYGEERWARRIAAFIVAARARSPVETTAELVEIIKAAIPREVRQAEDQHPARRTFQALRIAVNDELGALREGLKKALGALKVGGRMACITFHSLEDRIVKQFYMQHARGCICIRGLPQCVCGHHAELRIVTKKPLSPSPQELAENPRSRSAHLRVAEKLPVFY
ncbi:MAG: Ribosomal RNA small subunit methyltransferase H [Firmicutes bacterium]|nr:Ribosomal RNA small subunit methyltransferase H [Bacillota bacterium]